MLTRGGLRTSTKLGELVSAVAAVAARTVGAVATVLLLLLLLLLSLAVVVLMLLVVVVPLLVLLLLLLLVVVVVVVVVLLLRLRSVDVVLGRVFLSVHAPRASATISCWWRYLGPMRAGGLFGDTFCDADPYGGTWRGHGMVVIRCCTTCFSTSGVLLVLVAAIFSPYA